MTNALGIPIFLVLLLPYIVAVRWVDRKQNRLFNYVVVALLAMWGEAFDIIVGTDLSSTNTILVLIIVLIGSVGAILITHKYGSQESQGSPLQESTGSYILRSLKQLTSVEKVSLLTTVLLLVAYYSGNMYLHSMGKS